MNDTLKVVKGDKGIADDLRKRLYEALQPICSLVGEAKSHGFEVGFQFGENPFGQMQIQNINLLKKY